jgi:invasion protein IalB
VAPRPERTTASYGDWVLRCELPPGGAERSCEVAQTVLDGRGQTLAQIIARRAAGNGGMQLSVQVGGSATVAEPLRLAVETQAVLTLRFRRCLPRGCFAEVQPTEMELGALLPRTEPIRLEFTDGDGQPVSIPASLRGLAASLDALRAADRG